MLIFLVLLLSMTRSEMVISYMKSIGAIAFEEYEGLNRKKRLVLTYLHHRDICLKVTRTELIIEHKIQKRVLYSGTIPPSLPKFMDLLDWTKILL